MQAQYRKMDQELSGQSNEIIELYKRHVPDYVLTLSSALNAGDMEGIAFHAHKLCSAMKAVGKMKIAALLEEMQQPDIALSHCRSLFTQVEGGINESLAKLKGI